MLRRRTMLNRTKINRDSFEYYFSGKAPCLRIHSKAATHRRRGNRTKTRIERNIKLRANRFFPFATYNSTPNQCKVKSKRGENKQWKIRYISAKKPKGNEQFYNYRANRWYSKNDPAATFAAEFMRFFRPLSHCGVIQFFLFISRLSPSPKLYGNEVRKRKRQPTRKKGENENEQTTWNISQD